MFQSLVRVDWLWNQRLQMDGEVDLGGFNPSCGLIGCGTAFIPWWPKEK